MKVRYTNLQPFTLMTLGHIQAEVAFKVINHISSFTVFKGVIFGLIWKLETDGRMRGRVYQLFIYVFFRSCVLNNKIP